MDSTEEKHDLQPISRDAQTTWRCVKCKDFFTTVFPTLWEQTGVLNGCPGRPRQLPEPHPIFAFLDGFAAFEGVWFGERHPTRKGAFWWRSVMREALRAYAEEAVKQEREAYRELWTAAARVALSHGFDAAYPDNLAALKSMIQSTRGRARSGSLTPREVQG